MLFNSFEFAVFLPVIFALYWFVLGNHLRAQNVLLLAASYFFYGCWDYRFLSLILLSTVIDYGAALALDRTASRPARRAWLGISLAANLGMLGVFKYYDFFALSLAEALASLGIDAQPLLLEVILPVGISFYTFQTLSYTIDVYRRRLEPTQDFVAFATFVSFFPQLVAGPIERATRLLPQFHRPRHFEPAQAVRGMQEILWGLFKKVVVADTCATYVDLIFSDYEQYSSPTQLLAVIYFAIQIYGDFSGYSDIAIGCSRLFGFSLTRNFAFPYFSRDIAEFWRRWHISLSTWFRDYVYIPLGGSRGTAGKQVRNVMIIFLLSGFWHGANWTFLFWGALNGAYFLPLLLTQKNRRHMDVVAVDRIAPAPGEVLSMASTFALVCLGWVFFRATSLSHAFGYLGHMFSPEAIGRPTALYPLPHIAVLLAVDWLSRHHGFSALMARLAVPFRWGAYLTLAVLVIGYMSSTEDTFIYFQF